MKTSLVRSGYDQIAKTYFKNRVRLKSDKYVQKLIKVLPKQSTILDLGCGAGAPVDNWLIKAGHQVVGIDISSEQIKLARRNCPRGEYRVGDIAELRVGQYQVQAVISFYTWFHLPRDRHGQILTIVSSYLGRGGLLLLSMGDREFEGAHQMDGIVMWSSQYGPGKNRELVERAGFRVLLDEIDPSGGERHQVILAEKL